MKIARINDSCSGHGCWPSRTCDQGSPTVFVNSRAVHRVGDHWTSHTCESTHDSFLSSGSSTVFVEGKPIGRVGDQIACGSIVMTGSEDVFAG